MKRKRIRIILYVLIVVLLGVFGYSVYRYLSIQKDYREEQKAHDLLLQYRPELPVWADPDSPVSTLPEQETISPGHPETDSQGQSPDSPDQPERPEKLINESILRLRQDYPNAVGWITVPGTDVDYPIVQGKDNSYYLRRGIDGKYLYAGVPFLDYRCPSDFSGSNTIIFGHNLRNGSMFGTLSNFKKQSFFSQHRFFYVFLEHRTIQAEVIACLVITPDQAPYVFEPEVSADFAADCLRDARCARSDAVFSEADRFITLATCDYEKDNSRVILIGRICN